MYVSRFIGRSLLAGFAISAVAVPALAAGARPAEAGDIHMFVSHAAAYAAHHRTSAALDPDVFVADAQAAEGDGPEHVRHNAGFRPARPNDDPSAALYSANGTPLNLSVGRWYAARGNARVAADADGDRLAVRFTHLLPFGTYSLFAMRRDAGSERLEPLRTSAGTSAVTASPDGDARATVVIPADAQNADIALIMHSDDAEHDNSPGDLGVNAHVQLVLAQSAPANDALADPAADEADGPVPAPSADDDLLPVPDDTSAPRAAVTARPSRSSPDDGDEYPSDQGDDAHDSQSDSGDEHDAPPTDDGDNSDQAPI